MVHFLRTTTFEVYYLKSQTRALSARAVRALSNGVTIAFIG
jgi:hypothetical protein